MRILIAPMFALSAMNGPWSRAQKIAAAFQAAGYEAILAMAPDGNCRNPVTARVLELPVPSPLGAPMAITKRTFPLATKLGIAGRKPVRSYEEVLWLTGNLAYACEAEAVAKIREFIRTEHVDAVYSEFSLSAIIAAKAEGIPLVGTVSFPTQASYASAPAKAKGIRRLLGELDLPHVDSSLELFSWMDLRFVPSCPVLEPFEDGNVVYCGFMQDAPELADRDRDVLVFYLGTGTVPQKKLASAVIELASTTERDVYVAGLEPGNLPGTTTPANLHCAKRFDFSELLPRAAAFVNHGGQNSVMDALAYGAPQIIYPGKVFERLYNAASIEAAGAGVILHDFTASELLSALQRLESSSSYAEHAASLRNDLASLGGAQCIVAEAEKLFA